MVHLFDTDDQRVLAAVAADLGPDLLVVVDPDGSLRYGSLAARRMLGIDPAQHLGSQLLEWVHPEDLDAAVGAVSEATRSTGYHMPVVVRVRAGDGSWTPCEISGTTETGPGGPWLVLALRSMRGRTVVVERREELQRLVQRASLECARIRWYQVDELVEHLLGQLAGVVSAARIELAWQEESPELTVGAAWTDARRGGVGVVAGDRFGSVWPEESDHEALLRFTDDLAALPPGVDRDSLARAGFQSVVEVPLPSEHRAVLRLTFDHGGLTWDDTNTDVVCLLATILQSTLRRCLVEEQLHERARRDPMTGLLNRNELYGELSRMLGVTDRRAGRLGVLYGDLDRFKDVNDRFGHAEGDRLVLGVAGALLANVRDGDLVARFGGDEFVVVCPDLESPSQLDAIAARVEAAVRRLAPAGVPVGISFGRAVARHGQDADELLRLADESMYRTKRERRRQRA
jgi:diguanylate cyclase (GGDEF)-like protein/PAS domain S-box-containing protein